VDKHETPVFMTAVIKRIISDVSKLSSVAKFFAFYSVKRHHKALRIWLGDKRGGSVVRSKLLSFPSAIVTHHPTKFAICLGKTSLSPSLETAFIASELTVAE
jgi:hypothetical protein